MRILVCGGRDFDNYELVSETMFKYRLVCSCIIQGGAKGADSLGKLWAIANKIPVETYYAGWKVHGKKAGYVRNKQMLEEGKPDLVVAFPGGKGTAMMVKLAKDAGVKVEETDRAHLHRY